MSDLKRKAESLDDESDASMLECPICLEAPILPPIRQCGEGHVLCDSCSKQVSACPSCRGTPVNIRNRMAEQMAEKFVFCCRYAPRCAARVKYKELAEHVKNCEFALFACPFMGCDRCGLDMESVIHHMRDSHAAVDIPTTSVAGSLAATAKFYFTNPEGLQKKAFRPSIITALGERFLIFPAALSSDPNGYMIAVQFVGPRSRSFLFQYEVHVKSGRRAMSFSNYTRPVTSRCIEMFNTMDCFYVERGFAHFLSNAEGDQCGLNLTFDIKVSCYAGS